MAAIPKPTFLAPSPVSTRLAPLAVAPDVITSSTKRTSHPRIPHNVHRAGRIVRPPIIFRSVNDRLACGGPAPFRSTRVTGRLSSRAHAAANTIA